MSTTSPEYLATHCLLCQAYIDPMNGDAIGRFMKDGTEVVWCSEQHLGRWLAEGGTLKEKKL